MIIIIERNLMRISDNISRSAQKHLQSWRNYDPIPFFGRAHPAVTGMGSHFTGVKSKLSVLKL